MKFHEKFSIKTKLILAVAAVIVSLVLGIYTKIMLVVKRQDPFNFWLNVALYVFSWVILFVAGFFAGKETLEIADQAVRKKLQQTYGATVELQKAGFKKGIETTKRGFETTRDIGKKTWNIQKRILGIEELQFQKKTKGKKKSS